MGEAQSRGYMFYGRVWRILDAEHVMVIDCGKHIQIYHPDDLEVFDYDGRPDGDPSGDQDFIRNRFPVFYRMPSLRRLKKLAAHYAKETVWKRKRPRGTLPTYTYFAGRYTGEEFSDPKHQHLPKPAAEKS